MAKVFERIIYDQLYHYLNENDLLSRHQSDFRSLHSSVTALIEATDKWSSLGWLKTVFNTFQDVDFDVPLKTSLYQLMLQSWYQKTAQSLVNLGEALRDEPKNGCEGDYW